MNDNRPHFIFPNAKFNGKYFGAIPVDSQIGTIVLQVKVICLITVVATMILMSVVNVKTLLQQCC
jgi:hypothetical protein